MLDHICILGLVADFSAAVLAFADSAYRLLKRLRRADSYGRFPREPIDDGSCDPLYGQRIDDADLGRN
jgi:hypothetical protein